jgi:NodT family efflux transporter outer membrane factor (OMF) lipoprotein
MSSRADRPRATPRRAAIRLCLAALVAGCAVGPDYEAPQDPAATTYTPTAVTLAGGAGVEPQSLALGDQISKDWWELFRSQKLTDIVAQAIERNRTLVAARASLAQAQEGITQAAGARFPQVTLSSSASRQQTNFANSGIDQRGPAASVLSVGPQVSYTLDLFGGIARQIEKQQALADAQEYQLGAAYLNLTGSVVLQVIQIASTREQIAAVEDIVEQDRRNLASVQSSFDIQFATRIDLESASTQLATDRTQLPPLRQQLAVARDALAVLAGRPPAEWAPPDFALDELRLPARLPLSLPSELVHGRPDILAAEAQLRAANAQIGIATAALYPSITLSASTAQQALSPENLFLASSNIWSLVGNLTAPIFNGGALDAQRRAAEDAFRASLATYEQTVLQAFGQVADFLQALQHDAELVEAQKQALDSASSNVELTRISFVAGEASLLQLLDALRLYEQARLGYARAIAQRHSDTVQLFVAMGGGWAAWRAAEMETAAK